MRRGQPLARLGLASAGLALVLLAPRMARADRGLRKPPGRTVAAAFHRISTPKISADHLAGGQQMDTSLKLPSRQDGGGCTSPP